MSSDKFKDIVDFVEDHGGALGGEQRDALFRLCQAATAAEREACAVIATTIEVDIHKYPRSDGDYPYNLRQLIAAAIRARGKDST